MPREINAQTVLNTPARWGDGFYNYSVGVEVEDIVKDGDTYWRPLKVWLKSQKIGYGNSVTGAGVEIEGWLASENERCVLFPR